MLPKVNLQTFKPFHLSSKEKKKNEGEGTSKKEQRNCKRKEEEKGKKRFLIFIFYLKNLRTVSAMISGSGNESFSRFSA